uniref:MHC class I-like antigen recognition-like domain-containing protein n=1 Tax=Labrus bergylta TaxID=56723 RepID=A0A3Q3EJJ5_9LABR
LSLSLPLSLPLSLSLSLSLSLCIHIYQEMVGCEWDDENGDVNGYEQHGYDGEDFIALDLKTMTWVAAQQQAVFIKQMLDKNKAELEYLKNSLTKGCVDWLKKFVNYGRSSLMRTVNPMNTVIPIIPIIAIIAALVLLGLAVIGYKKYRGRKCKRHKLCSFWCFKFLNVILSLLKVHFVDLVEKCGS